MTKGSDLLVAALENEGVEHILMKRCGATEAEVTAIGHKRSAEVAGPDLVDEHARGERIFLIGDPAGEGDQPEDFAGGLRDECLLGRGARRLWHAPRPRARARRSRGTTR